MSDTPWMPFYVKDWLVSTRTLSFEQRGVYVELLALSWENVKIPEDIEACRKTAQCDKPTWRRVWPALEHYWPIVDGERRNPRLESERSKRNTCRERLSDAGKRGANLRWGGHSQAIARPMRPHCDGNGMPQSQSEDLRHDTGVPKVYLGDPKACLGHTPSSSSVPPSEPVYTPGQLRAGALGLAEAWNATARAHPPLVAVETGRLGADVSRALARHPSLDFWREVFDRVVASNYLMGRGDEPRAISFWKTLDKADRIHAGDYDNRAPKVNGHAPRQDPAPPPLAEVLAEQRRQREAREPRPA